jgi:hypothetical protein
LRGTETGDYRNFESVDQHASHQHIDRQPVLRQQSTTKGSVAVRGFDAIEQRGIPESGRNHEHTPEHRD